MSAWSDQLDALPSPCARKMGYLADNIVVVSRVGFTV
jgi:hypothetical protein